jgi:hypothetical protein
MTNLTDWVMMEIVDISSNNPVTLVQSKTRYDTRNIMLKYNLNRVAILKDKKNKN